MKKVLFALMALVIFNSNAQEVKPQSSSDFKRWEVRLRGIGVIPDESATIGIIGGDANLSNTFVPELDFTYFFTPHFAAELILGTTKHEVKTIDSDISAVGGPTNAAVDLGSVWLLPPTLTAQYHFVADNNCVFRPYIGAGINYTIFYNEKEGKVVKGVSYENNLGYAAQLGFDLKLTDSFYMNVDVKKLFLKTDLTVDASNLAPGLSIPADVTIDPWILGFGLGMKF